MKRTEYLLLLLILPLSLVAGCIQGQASISLNPDGSGSIKFEELYDPHCCRDNPTEISQTFQSFIKQIKNTLTESEGIEAWSDVDWRVLDNGKFYFKGHAFFKSINDVNIYLGNIKGNLKVSYQRNENQNCILELKSLKTEPNYTASAEHSVKRYEIFCDDVRRMIGKLQLSILINLPSNVQKSNGFEKIDSRIVKFVIDGKQLSLLFQSVKEQGQYELAEKCNFQPGEYVNNELLPGWLKSQKPLWIYFADSSESLFNYDKQVSEAKKDYSRILEKIELTAKPTETNIPVPSKGTEEPNVPPNSKIDSNDINARLRAGLSYEAKDKYGDAAEIYSKIIEANQTDAEHLSQAYYRLGMCYFEMGYTNKALEQFEYVLANYPSQRFAAVRSLKMIQDIRGGTAIRKADKNPSDTPAIISTNPEIYINDVNSRLDKITIKFSRPVQQSYWFYSSLSPGVLPQVIGEPSLDSSTNEWTLPVRLEPGKVYAIAFNCGDAVKDIENFSAGFRGLSGKMCKPFVLVFATADIDNMPTGIDKTLIKKAEEINSKN
ncbi:MAG: tetratricopeptide repeat protein [Sedimentisphaerales bacterium]